MTETHCFLRNKREHQKTIPTPVSTRDSRMPHPEMTQFRSEEKKGNTTQLAFGQKKIKFEKNTLT